MSQEFSTILYAALCACFGLSPSSSEASVLLREAYQDPENAPRPPRNTDVIYYSAAPVVTQNMNSSVQAPVSINVTAAGTDPEAVGRSIYDVVERYLLRTLQSI